MSRFAEERGRWFVVVAFAIAMAWMEAASVFYLRFIVGRIDPYQANPLPLHPVLGNVELVREAATMIMLLTMGMLAGHTWRKRIGYALIAFGGWDIFYYVFLRVITGWPRSVLDWDILFLLPLPWWGPVLAPACIALLMIAWGTLVTQCAEPAEPAAADVTRMVWSANAAGVALALYVFMMDSLHAIPQGLDTTRSILPTAFNWPLFGIALVLMATPIVHTGWRARRRRVDNKALCEIG